MVEPHCPPDAESIRSQASDSSSSPEFQPTRSHASRSRRRHRSGSASTSRSTSRQSSPTDIYRVPSGRYIDDQSVYYAEYYPTRSSSSDSRQSVSQGRQSAEPDSEKDIESVHAERRGTESDQGVDLESGAQRAQSNLEKSRTGGSTRSQYDPKLVGNLPNNRPPAANKSLNRSPGTGPTTQTIPGTGRRGRNGRQSCLYPALPLSHQLHLP